MLLFYNCTRFHSMTKWLTTTNRRWVPSYGAWGYALCNPLFLLRASPFTHKSCRFHTLMHVLWKWWPRFTHKAKLLLRNYHPLSSFSMTLCLLLISPHQNKILFKIRTRSTTSPLVLFLILNVFLINNTRLKQHTSYLTSPNFTLLDGILSIFTIFNSFPRDKVQAIHTILSSP